MLKRSLFFSAAAIAIALAIFVLFKPAPYEPITINSINDIKGHLEPGCLIAADFDNTLFECVDENQGSDQWFCACAQYFKQKGAPFSQVLDLYEKAHETAVIKPIESETIPVLQALQDKHIPLIIITSRSIIKQTYRQLHELSFSFASSHLGQKESLTLTLSKEPARYENGILFCGSNNKGEALAALLDTLQLNPTKIIFIDDKESHVQTVAQAMKKRNIPFVGLRYAFLDETVKRYHFDPKSIQLPDTHNDIAFAH